MSTETEILAAVDALPVRRKSRFYRVRQGPYRILYRVKHADGVLVIEAIGDRKDIYR